MSEYLVNSIFNRFLAKKKIPNIVCIYDKQWEWGIMLLVNFKEKIGELRTYIHKKKDIG